MSVITTRPLRTPIAVTFTPPWRKHVLIRFELYLNGDQTLAIWVSVITARPPRTLIAVTIHNVAMTASYYEAIHSSKYGAEYTSLKPKTWFQFVILLHFWGHLFLKAMFLFTFKWWLPRISKPGKLHSGHLRMQHLLTSLRPPWWANPFSHLFLKLSIMKKLTFSNN